MVWKQCNVVARSCIVITRVKAEQKACQITLASCKLVRRTLQCWLQYPRVWSSMVHQAQAHACQWLLTGAQPDLRVRLNCAMRFYAAFHWSNWQLLILAVLVL
jgi:hypothetical protein